MEKNDKSMKFKDFITSFSSAIMLTIIFGLIAVVFIFDSFIMSINTLPLNDIAFLNLIMTITCLIGVGYTITMLLRIQMTLNEKQSENR